MACLSYRYVEMPLRRGKAELSQAWGQVRRICLQPGLALFSAAVLVVWAQGFPGRLSMEGQRMATALASTPDRWRGDCHGGHRQAPGMSLDCQLGSAEAEPSILLIGDSHANHFAGFLQPLLEQAGKAAVDSTMDRCLPLLGAEHLGNPDWPAPCRERNQQALRWLQQQPITEVVLAGRWPLAEELSPQGQAQLQEAVERTLFTLRGMGLRVTLLAGVPALQHNRPDCPLKSARFGHPRQCRTSFPKADAVRPVLMRLAQKDQELRWLEPARAQCDAQCRMQIEGFPLYRDAAHLNLLGSEALGRAYAEQVGNPFVHSADARWISAWAEPGRTGESGAR